ncbi:MAG: ParA family protein [Deltaproteobacteria bacterium]|nr:ParA family protein [Deltaproteobacteria bacterium]
MLAETIKELLNVDQNRAFQGSGNKEAIVISICSQKGGVGKTTSTVNLGASLAAFFDKKTLLIDLDPQGHVHKSLGALIPNGVEYRPLSSLLLKKRSDLLDGVLPTEEKNLFITPGDKELIEAEGLLSNKIGKELILRDTLKAARRHFDFILIDCPPNLGNLTLNALAACDYCLLPSEMSVLAFEGVHDLVETLDTVQERINPELQLLGVFFTRVDGRNIKMNEIIESQMKQFFTGKVLKNRIPINTDLNKSQLEGRPVFHNYPRSTGSQNYQALAQEVLSKLKKLHHKIDKKTKSSSDQTFKKAS